MISNNHAKKRPATTMPDSRATSAAMTTTKCAIRIRHREPRSGAAIQNNQVLD
jgi:hypothetical protein